MLTPWLHLLIFGIVIALALKMIIDGVRLRRAATKPMCPKCAYELTGLTSPRCPECGADLRDIGLVPKGSRAEPFLLPLIGYSLVVLVLGPIVTFIIGHFLLPWQHTGTLDGYVHNQVRIEVEAGGDCYSYASAPAISPRTCNARLFLKSWGARHVGSITIKIPTLLFSYYTFAGKVVSSTRPLTESDVAKWFGDAGVDTPAKEQAEEIRETYELLLAIAQARDLKNFDSETRPGRNIPVRFATDPTREFTIIDFGYFDHAQPLIQLNPWGIWITLLLWLYTVRVVVPYSRFSAYFLKAPSESNVIH